LSTLKIGTLCPCIDASAIVAGWLVHRYGYGAAFALAASFMAVGAGIVLPVRLYRGARAV